MRREPGNEVDYCSRVGVKRCSPEGEEQCVTQTRKHRRCAMGRVKRKQGGGRRENLSLFVFFFSPPPLLSPSSALVTNWLPYGLLFLLSPIFLCHKIKDGGYCVTNQGTIIQSLLKNKIRRCTLTGHSLGRLQNSPYFCVFKYARAVKQKVSKVTPLFSGG